MATDIIEGFGIRIWCSDVGVFNKSGSDPSENRIRSFGKPDQTQVPAKQTLYQISPPPPRIRIRIVLQGRIPNFSEFQIRIIFFITYAKD